MKNLRLIQLFSILIITSCSKEESKTEQPIEQKPKIYVGGTAFDGDKSDMAYWKNGEKTIINVPTNENSFFKDISVVGTDVYAIGYRSLSFTIPMFYKNQTEITTNLTSVYQELKSLVVVNNIIYIAYTEYDSSNGTRPYLCQDSQKTFLNSGSLIEGQDSRINAMEVLDGKTHIVGFTEINAKNYATYWKDKASFLLDENNLKPGIATDVFISAQDVFIAGYHSNGNGLIWKNGIEITDLDETNSIRFSAIVVLGSDIYVAGVEEVTNGNKPRLWKNGISQNMDITNRDSTEITDMAVFNNDLYIVGTSYNNNGDTSKAHVWKNGTLVPELSKENARFESIFITK